MRVSKLDYIYFQRIADRTVKNTKNIIHADFHKNFSISWIKYAFISKD
jgi:hypothetical protein